MKLFCLPYAGAGAGAFLQMKAGLPGIEVVPACLPGRDHLFDQKPVDDIGVLVRFLATRYIEQVAEPYAIYGHSMGSLVGFELIRYLRRRNLPLPCHFMVGARGAPALSGEYEHLSSLNDERFITRVKQFGGLPDSIHQNEALMNFVMPTLRNDFRLLDNYQYLPDEPLPVPITTFHGMQDVTVRREWMLAWEFETSTQYRHVSLPGTHFFVTDRSSPLFQHMAQVLLAQREVLPA